MPSSKEYLKFLESKIKSVSESGFDIDVKNLNKKLFEFQKFIVKTALKKGRYALFEDCGLGKTIQQLEWAYQVSIHTNKPVLILCPLAVAGQTIKEGLKFGYIVTKIHTDTLITNGLYITNYEQLENIDCDLFAGVVLDESSILKNYSGFYRNLIIEKFAQTQFKLACTATPSPNDELEIGNHAEFLNIMSSQDMRAKYFTTDKEIIKGEKFRLKKHAEKDFYKWLTSWATMIGKPSDIGFEDEGYNLPNLNLIEKKVVTDLKDNGKLFNDVSVSAIDFNAELRITLIKRIEEVETIVNNSDENFIVWVKHNEESEKLSNLLVGAYEVKGSDDIAYKEKTLLDFADNKFKVLVTKSKIAQFGLNYQNCNNQVFASLDFSFEALYQSIRRSYRFGQKNEVNIYLITTDTMENVISGIKEKQAKFLKMQSEMIEATKQNLNKKSMKIKPVKTNIYKTEDYELILGDCVSEIKNIETESIDYSFFSPPFGALYVFSDSPFDLSNVNNMDEFYRHFEFLIPELFRVLKTGRLISMHIMQSTTLLGRDGYYSIKDFRGDLIRLFQKNGFYFHAENMIRKDPKTAAIRTKNRQLMWGTTKKDSAIVRPGLADFIITFKKPGENLVPIQNDIPFDLWCAIAEPVWLDIEEGDTLSYRQAKGENDERHITCTQLKAIRNCYLMWSNTGDTILSPFAGVCSEGYQALIMDRKFKGIELKENYIKQAVLNCNAALEEKKQLSLAI